MNKDNLDNPDIKDVLENYEEEIVENSETTNEEMPSENQDADTEAEDIVAEIGAKVEALESEKADLKDKLTRNLAEFDNFRKRTTKEKQSMYTDGMKEVIENILPTVDNFERALNAAEDKEDSFYIGVKMIFNQLMEQLKGMGVEEMNCLGEEFDPNLHHAVAQGDSDEYESNQIMEILQTGYTFKGKLLRPCMVKVVN